MGLRDFLFSKQRHIEERVALYLDAWEECLEEFFQAMEVYLAAGLSEEFGYGVQKVHKLESRADDLRREIEYEMYAKALLPESRGDILGMLENLDRIPNTAETLLFMLSSERIVFPAALAGLLGALLQKTREATAPLLEIARRIFAPHGDLLPLVQEVDDKESECDFIERELIARIFASSEVAGHLKPVLRDVAIKLANVTDHAENVADRLILTSLKRRV